MKKIILTCILCVVIVLGITGCDFPKPKRDSYISAQKNIEFLIDAINRKDSKAIKDKFSSYALINIENLDEKIDRFIDEFPGIDEDYEITDTMERWSNHGKITYILTPYYDFVVDDKEYRMRIIYYERSDEDKSKLGYYSIQIYERSNNSYSNGVYMHGVNDEPDILLWDYTRD